MTELKTIRALIAAKKAELHTFGDVNHLSRSEAEAVIDRHVDSLAAQGTARVGHAVALLLGGHGLSNALAVRSVGAPALLDLGAVLAAVLGADPLKAALRSHLADVPEGLPRAARIARRAEIDAELWTIEAREEALIVAAEASGQSVQRRADARPEIVLAIPPRADAAAPVADAPADATPPAPPRRKRGAMPEASGWLP